MFECPNCNGKISRHSVGVRVCQDCGKIHNIDELLNLLRDLGVTEKTIGDIKRNLLFPAVCV